MITERNGKFYRLETSEKEISEIEFLREKIKELEDKVSELQRRPTYIPYYPCPSQPIYPDLLPIGPIYCEPGPYQTTSTFTCEVRQ